MGLFTNVKIDRQLLPKMFVDLVHYSWQTKDIVNCELGTLLVKPNEIEYINSLGEFTKLEYTGKAVFYTDNGHKYNCENHDFIELKFYFEDGLVGKIENLTPNAKTEDSWNCCHPILSFNKIYEEGLG